MNLQNMSAVKIGKLIKDRKISSPEVITEIYKNIKNQNNAYVSLTKEYAFHRAKKIQKLIDKGTELSILSGVPISIKDNICTKGIKTTACSKMLENYIPNYSATVFKRLEDAGVIMIGKLNMDEFAMGDTGETSYFGECKNPFGQNRITGGSSSGCASALSYKEAIFSLGSDTGGSIRQPSSFCSITGIKPTYGSVSQYGLIGFAPEFDQIGPMANDVLDCAKTLEIISGYDKYDKTTIKMKPFNFSNLEFNIKGIKIGVAKNFIEFSAEDVKTEIFNSIKILEKMGAIIEYFELDILDICMPTYQILSGISAIYNMEQYGKQNCENFNEEIYIKNRTEKFGSEVKKRIMFGHFVSKEKKYFESAINARIYIKNKFKEAFYKYDVILTPTTPKTAPCKGDTTETDIFLVGANLAGIPALSIPCAFAESKMPVGLHLMADKLKDELLIRIGVCFQNEINI